MLEMIIQMIFEKNLNYNYIKENEKQLKLLTVDFYHYDSKCPLVNCSCYL